MSSSFHMGMMSLSRSLSPLPPLPHSSRTTLFHFRQFLVSFEHSPAEHVPGSQAHALHLAHGDDVSLQVSLSPLSSLSLLPSLFHSSRTTLFHFRQLLVSFEHSPAEHVPRGQAHALHLSHGNDVSLHVSGGNGPLALVHPVFM
jgi:antitoxin component of MazEF toxin-antitoxin module